MAYLDMHKSMHVCLVARWMHHNSNCGRLDEELVIQAHLDESDDEST